MMVVVGSASASHDGDILDDNDARMRVLLLLVLLLGHLPPTVSAERRLIHGSGTRISEQHEDSYVLFSLDQKTLELAKLLHLSPAQAEQQLALHGFDLKETIRAWRTRVPTRGPSQRVKQRRSHKMVIDEADHSNVNERSHSTVSEMVADIEACRQICLASSSCQVATAVCVAFDCIKNTTAQCFLGTHRSETKPCVKPCTSFRKVTAFWHVLASRSIFFQYTPCCSV